MAKNSNQDNTADIREKDIDNVIETLNNTEDFAGRQIVLDFITENRTGKDREKCLEYAANICIYWRINAITTNLTEETKKALNKNIVTTYAQYIMRDKEKENLRPFIKKHLPEGTTADKVLDLVDYEFVDNNAGKLVADAGQFYAKEDKNGQLCNLDEDDCYRYNKYKEIITQAISEYYATRQTLPVVIPTQTDTITITIDNATTRLFNNTALMPKGEAVPVGTSKAKENIYTLVKVDYDGLPVTFSKELNAFDKRVFDIVCSLYSAGNEIISFAQITEYLFRTNKYTTTQINKVRASIAKLVCVRVSLDCKDEANAFYKDMQGSIDDFKKVTYLLPAEEDYAKIKGKTVSSITLLSAPKIFLYAQIKQQIITVDIGLLAGPLQKTTKCLALESYLLTFLHQKKHELAKRKGLAINLDKENKRTTLTLKTINEHTLFADKKHIDRLVTATNEQLKFLKGKEFIKSYKYDEAEMKYTICLE